MPIPKDESDMEANGWAKELTIKHIVVKRGIFYVQEYDYFADQMPCRVKARNGPACGNLHTWITCFNGSLFWCCFKHKICNGPISFEVGNKVKEETIGTKEAFEVCRETGQEPPQAIMEVYQEEEAAKYTKRRRPTKK